MSAYRTPAWACRRDQAEPLPRRDKSIKILFCGCAHTPPAKPVLDYITRASPDPDEASVRPLYLGAATNLAASVTADAVGFKATALRKGLATVMAE